MPDQAQKLREMVTQQDTVDGSGSVDLSARRERKEWVDAPRAEVYTVTSGKGGVGKSNVAVNLGIALAQKGRKVAVVDMDLGLANVNVITGASPSYNLFDVFKGRKQLSEIVEKGPGGLLVVAGASGKNELANLDPSECEQFLNQLSQLDRAVDMIILDTAAGLSRSVLQFVRGADQTILVTTPEPTAITDAYALIKSAVNKQPKPRFQLVVNRANSIMEASKVSNKMSRVANEFLSVSIGVLGYMVEDEAVPRSVRKRRPFILDSPESTVSQCVSHLSERLLNPHTEVKPTGIQNFFQTVMGWMRGQAVSAST